MKAQHVSRLMHSFHPNSAVEQTLHAALKMHKSVPWDASVELVINIVNFLHICLSCEKDTQLSKGNPTNCISCRFSWNDVNMAFLFLS